MESQLKNWPASSSTGCVIGSPSDFATGGCSCVDVNPATALSCGADSGRSTRAMETSSIQKAFCLHTFPKCKSVKYIEDHVEAFEEMVDKHGQMLIDHAPGHLAVMVKNTLPTEMQDELLNHPEVRDWEAIIDWCRKKMTYKNQKHLASFYKPGSLRVAALSRPKESGDESDDDEPARPRGRQAAGPVASLSPELNDLLVAALQHTRPHKRTPSPGRDAKKRFVWAGGCHECGGDHMKRDCPAWTKLMAANHNKMPEGHVNAYSKALDAFRKKKRH